MVKINHVTTKGFVNINSDKPSNIVDQVRNIINRYPGYKVKPNITPNDYKNSDKVYIYGWYWRGEWSDPTKEHFATLYKPKKVSIK